MAAPSARVSVPATTAAGPRTTTEAWTTGHRPSTEAGIAGVPESTGGRAGGGAATSGGAPRGAGGAGHVRRGRQGPGRAAEGDVPVGTLADQLHPGRYRRVPAGDQRVAA